MSYFSNNAVSWHGASISENLGRDIFSKILGTIMFLKLENMGAKIIEFDFY